MRRFFTRMLAGLVSGAVAGVFIIVLAAVGVLLAMFGESRYSFGVGMLFMLAWYVIACALAFRVFMAIPQRWLDKIPDGGGGDGGGGDG